jgi:hypothetical protein
MVARCLVVSGGSVTLWLVALAPVSLVARWLRWSGESVDRVDGKPIFWWWWLWHLGTLAPVDLVVDGRWQVCDHVTLVFRW